MVALSNACFEFADEVPKDVQHGSHLHALLEVAVCEVLRVGVFSSALFVAMLRSYQPPYQGPRTNPVLRAGA